jgi:putative two-component system response regulator
MTVRASVLSDLDVVFHDAGVLIVDDDAANVLLLRRVLETAGYTRVHTAGSAAAAVALFVEVQPDIVLLDLHMPDVDGMELMRRLRRLLAPGEFLPMVMLTGDMSPGVRRGALASGAIDFLTKPFELDEVRLRIRNLLHTRILHRELRGKADELEARVSERTAQLSQARADILERLARAADFRDDATGEHTRRVGSIAGNIALELGVGSVEAERIGRAAMLHDIGKIGVPDSILLKPGPLTEAEFAVIRRHTTIGRDILAGSPARVLQVAAVIAHTHHERWDGAGYHGLVGAAIPLEGRIVAVADTFDALVTDRPYRAACAEAAALAEMRAHRGTQFDPAALDAFLRVAERGGIAGSITGPASS